MMSTTMKTLYMSYVIVLVCQFAQPLVAWGSNNRGSYGSGIPDEQKLLQIIRDVKRRQFMPEHYACARWDYPCNPGSSNRYMKCCDIDNTICKCTLWGNNCRCKSRLFSK